MFINGQLILTDISASGAYTPNVSGYYTVYANNNNVYIKNYLGNSQTINSSGGNSTNSSSIQTVSGNSNLNSNCAIVIYKGNTISTLILPNANSNSPNSVNITIKHWGTNNLNIAPQVLESIEGGIIGASIIMVPQQALQFISDPITNSYYIS